VDGKILLQHETHAYMPEHPFYSLPGGKGNFDEDPLRGAQRELSEESGYESSDWELFTVETETGKIAWPQYVFIARGAQKTHEAHPDGGEKIEPLLLSVDTFFEYVQRLDFRGFLIKHIVREIINDEVKKEAFLKAIQG
jgi:ADP-ribose pyrophosphatase